MRRRARTNLWLAILVTALLIAGIETLRHDYKRTETGHAPLLALDPLQVLAIHIERGDKNPVHLEQEDGSWRMTAPMKLPADQLRVAPAHR